MRILLLTILLVGAPFVAAETEPETPASNADRPKKATGPLSAQEAKFQGTWKGGYTVIIEGRDFCADTQPGEWYEGYIVIRTDEEPAQIDFVIEECPDCSFKGQASPGIFYWDGETIVVSAPPPGEARARDFEKPKDGRAMTMMRLKRDGKSQFPAEHCLKE